MFASVMICSSIWMNLLVCEPFMFEIIEQLNSAEWRLWQVESRRILPSSHRVHVARIYLHFQPKRHRRGLFARNELTLAMAYTQHCCLPLCLSQNPRFSSFSLIRERYFRLPLSNEYTKVLCITREYICTSLFISLKKYFNELKIKDRQNEKFTVPLFMYFNEISCSILWSFLFYLSSFLGKNIVTILYLRLEGKASI